MSRLTHVSKLVDFSLTVTDDLDLHPGDRVTVRLPGRGNDYGVGNVIAPCAGSEGDMVQVTLDDRWCGEFIWNVPRDDVLAKVLGGNG